MVEKQGLDFLYQFQEIYGTTTSERLLEVKQMAIEDGLKLTSFASLAEIVMSDVLHV